MKPSIGRIIHINWHGQRVPGVITFVESDTIVRALRLDGSNLITTPLHLAAESEQSSKMVNGMLTPNHTWSWPPRV